MRTLLLALVAVLLLAAPASADRRCESDHPIYGLKTFNGPRCGTALVVASRITNRYDDSGDFSGQRSTTRITQRDASGNKWRCNWEQSGRRHSIINWACGRGDRVITWIWRKHRL